MKKPEVYTSKVLIGMDGKDVHVHLLQYPFIVTYLNEENGFVRNELLNTQEEVEEWAAREYDDYEIDEAKNRGTSYIPN